MQASKILILRKFFLAQPGPGQVESSKHYGVGNLSFFLLFWLRWPGPRPVLLARGVPFSGATRGFRTICAQDNIVDAIRTAPAVPRPLVPRRIFGIHKRVF
jgi:hypothetical protein